MTKHTWIESSFCAAVLLLARSTSAQQPRPLSTRDFVVAGLSDRTDSATVRARLGPPDSVTTSEHPSAAGVQLIEWWYSDLRVGFNGTDTVAGVWLLRSNRRTARGLRVGDAVSRMRQLYGKPLGTDPGTWVYRDPATPDGEHLIKAWTQRGRVSLIYIGWTFD